MEHKPLIINFLPHSQLLLGILIHLVKSFYTFHLYFHHKMEVTPSAFQIIRHPKSTNLLSLYNLDLTIIREQDILASRKKCWSFLSRSYLIYKDQSRIKRCGLNNLTKCFRVLNPFRLFQNVNQKRVLSLNIKSSKNYFIYSI